MARSPGASLFGLYYHSNKHSAFGRRLERVVARAAWLDEWVAVDSEGVEVVTWTQVDDR